MASDGNQDQNEKLGKNLGLLDIYCIATGAMFSSGFFLLPGLAFAGAGPAAAAAYLIASVLMIPAMLSILELSTALPRAGGAYYFLDRSLGPAVGTVAGVGIWLSMILKSAFALVGIGAYLAITPGLGAWLESAGIDAEWLVKLLAAVMAVGFVALNILGARETVRLQKLLVVAILAVLGLFIVQGMWHVFTQMPDGSLGRRYTPFLSEEQGWEGLFGTVGLVFVSYAGLTQIASVSEEVRQPAKNLPLAMILSLATAATVYVLGVFLIIGTLDPGALRDNQAPVAAAAAVFSPWLPPVALTGLVIVAALAAFASTGNAGLLAASRYPLAMARDRLVPERFGKLGRSGTPTRSIMLTGGLIVTFILALSTEGVAKLGSTFNLLVFGMANLAVIVMRESRIESYDPGFRVPFYPWLPLAGFLVSGWLIVEMGWLSTIFALGVVAVSGYWYLHYARPKVERYGAVHHVFARLGQYRHPQLREEFREIIKEKGLQEDDPYDEVVHRAEVLDVTGEKSFDEVVAKVAEALAGRVGIDADEIREQLLETGRYGGLPLSQGVVLLHFRDEAVERAEMALVRIPEGIRVTLETDDTSEEPSSPPAVNALFVVVSPAGRTGQHLRFLAQLAERAEAESFLDTWLRFKSTDKLKESILQDSRFLELFVGEDESTQGLIGREIREIEFPSGAFPALIRRDHESFEPRGDTRLESGDYLTIIGEPEAIGRLAERFVEPDES